MAMTTPYEETFSRLQTANLRLRREGDTVPGLISKANLEMLIGNPDAAVRAMWAAQDIAKTAEQQKEVYFTAALANAVRAAIVSGIMEPGPGVQLIERSHDESVKCAIVHLNEAETLFEDLGDDESKQLIAVIHTARAQLKNRERPDALLAIRQFIEE